MRFSKSTIHKLQEFLKLIKVTRALSEGTETVNNFRREVPRLELML